MEDDYYGEWWFYLTPEERRVWQKEYNKAMNQLLDNIAPTNVRETVET